MPVNLMSVIQRPLITERSASLKEKYNQYVFKVNPESTKAEIRDAVGQIFKVEVEEVRTSNYDGKLRRLAMGRPQGRKNSWKKAIVTLKKGQEIKLEPEAR